MNFVKEHLDSLDCLLIDAPLSLPRVYSDDEVEEPDFFYREADRKLKAMSPLFLGGLTARAMRLAFDLKGDLEIKETYPKALLIQLKSILDLDLTQYKKESTAIPYLVDRLLSLDIMSEYNIRHNEVDSWHHFDALVVFISALRYKRGLHKLIGTKTEGQIIY